MEILGFIYHSATISYPFTSFSWSYPYNLFIQITWKVNTFCDSVCDNILIYLFFKFLHNIFWWCYFPLVTPPRTYQLPYASYFMLFPFFENPKDKNYKTKATTIATHIHKPNKTKTLESVLYWSVSWVWGLPWSVFGIPSVTSLEKNDFILADINWKWLLYINGT